jgi:hypothetical protein
MVSPAPIAGNSQREPSRTEWLEASSRTQPTDQPTSLTSGSNAAPAARERRGRLPVASPRAGEPRGRPDLARQYCRYCAVFPCPKGLVWMRRIKRGYFPGALRGRRRTHFRFVRPGFGEGEGEGAGGGAMSMAVNAWASQASMITDSRSPLKSLLS